MADTQDTMESTSEISESEEIVSVSKKGYFLIQPRSNVHRFVALIFMCFLGFGSYFCCDNPGALQDKFINNLSLQTSQFAQLYSWYSWPNVVLCFMGGYLTDNVFGIRLATVIFCVFIVVGQLLFALGTISNRFWVMVFGRFIFGMGGESIVVAQNTYAVRWFAKGKMLNLAFGLQNGFARMGSTVNYLVMDSVYNWMQHYFTGYTGLGFALLIALFTCLLSLLSAMILAVLDYRAEKVLEREAEDETDAEIIQLSDIKHFPVKFWLMCGICIAYYVAVFPFIALGKVFFERKFQFTPDQANTVDSLIYIVSAVFSPVFGLLIDKLGRHTFWMFLTIMATILSHGLLAFTFVNPYVAMVIMGLAYALLAGALWPMVALIVPEHQLATAYGILQAVQNLGLAVIAILSGYIVDSVGYLILELFYLCWLAIALACVVLLWLCDTSINNISIEQRNTGTYEPI